MELSHTMTRTLSFAIGAALAGALVFTAPATAAPQATASSSAQAGTAWQLATADAGGITLRSHGGTLHFALSAPDTVHLRFVPKGVTPKPTLVVDPHAPQPVHGFGRISHDGDRVTLASRALSLQVDTRSGRWTLRDAAGNTLLSQPSPGSLAQGDIHLEHAAGQSMYGIHGYDAWEKTPNGLLRHGASVAKAGHQGWAGAPFVWSTAGYGVLVDTMGATFDLSDTGIAIGGLSTKMVDMDLMVGAPKVLFAALTRISGRAPLFPKWAMGFTNSQWGIDEKELKSIVATYRARHIPIDNFTLDFDWKAWGQDHYGEFRWNVKKFPDGPSGRLKTEMAAEGMHLTGIMKPRIHVDTEQGRYATAHHFWVPGEKTTDDYFSHKPVRDIDFDIPAARTWFADHIKHAYETGIAGWWNDEADNTGDDSQFMNMQRAIYDGQRSFTDQRVWSINRNFYLGSQRYAYGLWSGDIKSGFDVMAAQRVRMLSAIDVGEMKWGMDTGGFQGHPSDQNYARWMEFAAFVPIFRVHGTDHEKRQPWRYGPIAEKAAVHAIRLRYSLIPYIYSYEHNIRVNGVGLVRPLTFSWPHDARVRNDVDAWMFGDWLLVSPVVVQDQTHKSVYLPAGTWTDYFSGKVYQGGHTVSVKTDAKGWSDIPLFVRQGAIIPSQPVMDYVGQRPVPTLGVDMFPAVHATHFDYYDDDGRSYAYEHGDYFIQRLSTQRDGAGVSVRTDAATGSYAPALRHYLLKVHGLAAAHAVAAAGALRHYASLQALEAATGQGWATGSDRYGQVTYLKLDAGPARSVRLDRSK